KQGEIFDITRLELNGSESPASPLESPASAMPGNLHDRESSEEGVVDDRLSQAAELDQVEVTRARMPQPDPLQAILEAAKGHPFVVVGARPPGENEALSLGELQDRLIKESASDVLAVVQEEGPPPSPVKRILVPVNSLEFSMAAGDVAASLAQAHDAELVLFHVRRSQVDSFFWQERQHQELLEAGYHLLRELKFRVERLGVQSRECVRVGKDPGKEILKQLRRESYQWVVMGASVSPSEAGLQLGSPIEAVLTQARVPTLLLVTHPTSGTKAPHE
ncbi:MAG: universal stress protein, partial [Armatimonadetes bacterium]|nr:universal stress protein [Armatimonadota bacterium]